jgi:hypothetical protein
MFAPTDDRDKSELLESWGIGSTGRTDTAFWNADLFFTSVPWGYYLWSGYDLCYGPTLRPQIAGRSICTW